MDIKITIQFVKERILQLGGQQSILESTLHMKKKAQTHNMIQGASFVTFCGNSFYMYNSHLIRKLLLRKKSKLLHDSWFNTLSAI